MQNPLEQKDVPFKGPTTKKIAAQLILEYAEQLLNNPQQVTAYDAKRRLLPDQDLLAKPTWPKASPH